MKKYKYFCNHCGYHFESELPERDSNGLLNDILCPHCGDAEIYPDTVEGSKRSVKAVTEYENTEMLWTDND